MRAEKTTDHVVLERGDVAAAFAAAAHVASGTYHGAVSGARALRPELRARRRHPRFRARHLLDAGCLRHAQHSRRILGLPAEKVRVQYYEGSGTYGHSCYDDVAQAAAILSQLPGKPVRLQFMRWDEHGWDNYGPAHVGEVRAAADATGKIVAYEYHGWQHNWSAVETSAAVGARNARRGMAARHGAAGESGPTAAECTTFRICASSITRCRASAYLKGAWLRSPLDLSFSFASEQTIDELARLPAWTPTNSASATSPTTRWLGVLDAAAKAANWKPRAPASNLSNAKIVTGRGIGLGTHLVSYGGAVAEIEVNRETGKVAVKHMYGAIDAGLAVNPAFVENQISGQLVQAASRMLHEEVTFNNTNVTSLDWNSYPILRFEECPEVTAVVRAAPRSAFDRRGRRGDGRSRRRHRQRVLRRHRRAHSGISAHAAARPRRAPPGVTPVARRSHADPGKGTGPSPRTRVTSTTLSSRADRTLVGEGSALILGTRLMTPIRDS